MIRDVERFLWADYHKSNTNPPILLLPGARKCWASSVHGTQSKDFSFEVNSSDDTFFFKVFLSISLNVDMSFYNP